MLWCVCFKMKISVFEMPRISLEGMIVPLLAVIYIYMCLFVCVCVCVCLCVYVCVFVRDGHLLSELAIIGFRPGAEV